MDREERDKLERLGTEASLRVRGTALEGMKPGDMQAEHLHLLYVRAALDAVLPAYDAMRDAEWEQVGYVAQPMRPGKFKTFYPMGGTPTPTDVPAFVRRVGKEGGS